MTYCFRTCEPSSLLPVYKHFDSLQLATFSSILGRSLDENAHAQMFLPIKIGGAGLRSAAQHCPAAFIASVSQTRSNVDKILPERVCRRDTTSAFPMLQTRSGNATYTDFDLLPAEFTQHSLSAEIDKHNLTNLLGQASIRNKSRLLSLNLPHAGDSASLLCLHPTAEPTTAFRRKMLTVTTQCTAETTTVCALAATIEFATTSSMKHNKPLSTL